MTDGNTGFHVAPITEDEMFKVKDILQRAADAIVGMSQLSADVDMLRQTVAGLQADAERLRNQNNALDEALNHSRAVRDEQARKLAEVESNLYLAKATEAEVLARNDSLVLQNDQLQIDLDLTRKERDEAQFEVLELKEKLASANARIEQANKLASDMASLFKPDEPEAKPEPPKSFLAGPDNVPTTWAPPPTEPPPVIDTRPHSREHWEPGYFWDAGTSRYWRDGVTPKADGEAIPF